MKFVLFSDLHLDAPFGWDGPSLAAQRRTSLRNVLGKILSLADQVHADAVLCGGDVFEHSLSGADTGEHLRSAFESIAPIPIFIAPGNHDWFGPESLYERVGWSPNVHIFSEGWLSPLRLQPGLTLWGAAHRAPLRTNGFLDAFRVDGNGVHIALFHGSESKGMAHDQRADTSAPFSEEQIPASGLHHAFVGHYHEHHDGEYHTYAGNPDPLTISEKGEVGSLNRGAVVVDIEANGAIRRQRHRVAVTEVHDITLDVASAHKTDEIDSFLEVALDGLTGIARVTINGVAGYDVRLERLQDIPSSLDRVFIRHGAKV